MSVAVKLAKAMMKLFPSRPTYDPNQLLSEMLNHRNFVDARDEQKDEMLFDMALRHYNWEQEKPYDHYFPGYSFRQMLAGKTVLDLGCFFGGKTVCCAEKWGVNKICGIDINEYFIHAAKLFSRSRENQEIAYDFKTSYAESLPYEDHTFDAIVSYDVLEHVQSVKDTLMECKRVLKPGGMLFSVFPSYYTPGESHLSLVTYMPVIQWLFGPETLNRAYNDVLRSRGKEAYWYTSNTTQEDDWKVFDAGIGVNGTTFRGFKSDIQEVGFSNVTILPTPFFSVGILSLHYPVTKYLGTMIKPFLRSASLQDYLSHRIVSVLVV